MPRFRPQILRSATGQFYDLVVEAPCPRCGWELADRDFIDHIPDLDAWDTTVRARCEHCGTTFHVRFDIEGTDPAMGGPLAPPIRSWFGSMRRPAR